MQELIPKVLVSVLREARSVVALTGAGVSAESGIPTFRDAMDGLWSKYDAYTLATPGGFAKDPALVTKWYDWRRQLCAKAQPRIPPITRWHDCRRDCRRSNGSSRW